MRIRRSKNKLGVFTMFSFYVLNSPILPRLQAWGRECWRWFSTEDWGRDHTHEDCTWERKSPPTTDLMTLAQYFDLLLSSSNPHNVAWVQPEPIKNLNELTKAQLAFHAAAAEALQAVQGEIDELSIAAEGEYRWVMWTILLPSSIRTDVRLHVITAVSVSVFFLVWQHQLLLLINWLGIGSPATTEVPLHWHEYIISVLSFPLPS